MFILLFQSDLAGKVFQKIKHDYFLVKTASLRYSVDQFNHLLETYATKAVEVMVVQCVESGTSGLFQHCSVVLLLMQKEFAKCYVL